MPESVTDFGDGLICLDTLIQFYLVIHKTTFIAQKRDKPFHNDLTVGDLRCAINKIVVFEDIEHPTHTLFNARRIPAVTASQLRVNRWNPDIRCRLSELTFWPLLV